MTVVRVQHIFNSKTALPEDGVVNTFHFRGVGPATVEVAQSLVAALESFYNGTTAGAGTSLREWIAGKALATKRDTYKVYDLSQPKPRPLLYTVTPTPVVANNPQPAIPPEVAVCLSFRATPAAGVSVTRSRGRIYFGPLNMNVLGEEQSTFTSRPNGVNGDLILAGERLEALARAAGWPWVVYSPTTDAGTGNPAEPATTTDQATWDVHEVSTDDAWDIQRRRGNKPTKRNRLTVPIPV